jgi:ATP-binding cassette subfamily F protein uup
MDFVGSRLGRKIMAARNLTKAWGDLTVVDDFTYSFGRNERVGIIGPNGAGKTSLLELLAGRIEPDSGEVEVGETVVLGYVDQQGSALDPDQRVFDAVNDINPHIRTSEGTISASKMLDQFLFEGEKKHGYIHTLSGGEKRRLHLLMVLMREPNVLFLDEPTNDLDVETLTVLEDYLDGFNGVVVVVSHDRFFLDRNIDHLLEVEHGGNITEFPGTYTPWAEAKAEREVAQKRAERKEAAAKAAEASAPTQTSKTDQTTEPAQKSAAKLSYNDQREYDTLQARIPTIEARLEELDAEMVTAATDHELLGELAEERRVLAEELEAAFERWMELEELGA